MNWPTIRLDCNKEVSILDIGNRKPTCDSISVGGSLTTSDGNKILLTVNDWKKLDEFQSKYEIFHGIWNNKPFTAVVHKNIAFTDEGLKEVIKQRDEQTQ